MIGFGKLPSDFCGKMGLKTHEEQGAREIYSMRGVGCVFYTVPTKTPMLCLVHEGLALS